ncbi:MAG: TetR/AcrR family transcriptional regulator [Candidatus Saccharibacteria bacterium]|nr:TetR/AcrR family transcriptional regulator [Candidatus Saccharibacteria bacterium]
MPIKRKIQAPFMANRPSEHALRKSALELSGEHPLGTISIAKLCRKSHISRRAFYNQYISMSDFYLRWKRDFENEVGTYFVEMIKRGYGLETNIIKILAFIRKYHVLFRATLQDDNYSLLEFLIQSTKPLIMDEWQKEILANKIGYDRRTQFYRRFAFRLAEKLDIWIRWQDCTETEIPKLQGDIIKLINDFRNQMRRKEAGPPSKVQSSRKIQK